MKIALIQQKMKRTLITATHSLERNTHLVHIVRYQVVEKPNLCLALKYLCLIVINVNRNANADTR